MAQLEVNKIPDGKTLTRRLDDQPLTPQGPVEARRVIQEGSEGDIE